MTRDQHLVSCKVCENRKTDLQRGLVCKLTNEYADFEMSCPDYAEDTTLSESQKYALSKSKGPFPVTTGIRFANYVIDRIVLRGLGGVFGAILGALWMVISPDNFYELERP